jgi:hypothetical protein
MTDMMTGRSMWGQASRYTAFDDRLALTALTGGRAGIARAAAFGEAPGPLDVTIDGGWLAIADAGDGTVMIAGTLDPGTLTLLPGGEDGTRRDLIYCYVMPDEGTWFVSAALEADTAGRPGIALATVDVPAGATSAGQMVITPRPAEFVIEGARGPAGPPGATGPQGTAVNIRGNLGSTSELPAQGNPGDAWLIDGDLWVWGGGGAVAAAAAGAAPLANWALADPAGSPTVLETVAGSDGIVGSSDAAGALTLGAADPWGAPRAAQYANNRAAIWIPPAILNRMLSGPHTLQALVRTTAGPYGTILGGNDRHDNAFVFFGMSTGGALGYRRAPGQLVTATGTQPVNDGNWHRVGFRVANDLVTLTLWVDGANVSQITLSTSPARTLTVAAIGHSGVAGEPNGWVGYLARVRVWDRALTDAEMAGTVVTGIYPPGAQAQARKEGRS